MAFKGGQQEVRVAAHESEVRMYVGVRPTFKPIHVDVVKATGHVGTPVDRRFEECLNGPVAVDHAVRVDEEGPLGLDAANREVHGRSVVDVGALLENLRGAYLGREYG